VDPWQIGIFILLICLSAFFSGTEIAFLNTSKHTIKSLVKEKRWWAKSLEIIKSDMDKLLITVMIGNNLVNVAASALGTIASISLAKSLSLPDEYGLLIATGVVTFIILIFGDITPKTIFARFSSPISLAVAPIYRVLIPLFSPVSFFLDRFIKWFARLLGAEHINPRITASEVEAFIDMSHEWGAVEADERRQIKNLLSLAETTADSVMTPRVNVEFAKLDDSVDEVCEFFMTSSHSRLPVAGDSTDDTDYVITFREAFKLQREWHGKVHLHSLDLEKIMKVSLTQRLDDLFEKFQKSRRHIALVLDEHWGTAWVVTMEDVLEEVFGDIKDEKDREEIYMKKSKNGKIEAVGTVLIDDILEEYDIHSEDYGIPEEYAGEPISYVIMAEEENLPNKGTEIVFRGHAGSLTIRVIDVHDNVIEKVECEKYHD
jgi:putative hemolysin